MSLFAEIETLRKAGELECITGKHRPYIGGWYGDIFRAKDGRVFASLDRDRESQIVAEVPKPFASIAERVEFDPYNDAKYARETIQITKDAIRSCLRWQTGRKHVKEGRCPLLPIQQWEFND